MRALRGRALLTRLRGARLALGLALVLAAAGQAAQIEQAQAAQSTLVLLRGGDSVTLDPARSNDSESALATGQIFEGLVRIKEDSLQVEPCLAESWQVSGDGLTWTFRLRRGVNFHDGTALTAQAATQSILRQIDPSHPFHTPGMYTAKSLFEHVAGAEATDASTLRIRLARPSAGLLQALAAPQAALVSPQTLAAWTRDPDARPAGTGPFQLVEWQRGTSVTLARNPGYWGEKPELERLVLRAVPDAALRLKELQSARADVATGLPPSLLALAEKASGVRLLQVPGLSIAYLGINTQRGPFKKAGVRRAVALALDREGIVRLVYGAHAAPAASLLPPSLLRQEGLSEPPLPKADPAQARRLLAAEGHPGGLDALLQVMDIPRAYAPEPQRLAQTIRKSLAAAGIRVRIVTVPWDRYLLQAGRGEHDLCLTGWTFDAPSAHEFLRFKLGWESAAQGASGNVSLWRDARFQALEPQFGASAPGRARQDLLRRVLAIVEAETPVVPLAHVRDAVAVRDEVQGLALSQAGALLRFTKVRKVGP